MSSARCYGAISAVRTRFRILQDLHPDNPEEAIRLTLLEIGPEYGWTRQELLDRIGLRPRA